MAPVYQLHHRQSRPISASWRAAGTTAQLPSSSHDDDGVIGLSGPDAVGGGGEWLYRAISSDAASASPTRRASSPASMNGSAGRVDISGLPPGPSSVMEQREFCTGFQLYFSLFADILHAPKVDGARKRQPRVQTGCDTGQSWTLMRPELPRLYCN